MQHLEDSHKLCMSLIVIRASFLIAKRYLTKPQGSAIVKAYQQRSKMMKKYGIDERLGCVAVIDNEKAALKTKTNLQADLDHVVEFWEAEELGNMDIYVKAAFELCNKLNQGAR